MIAALLCLAAAAATGADAPSPAGIWEGTLKAGPTDLRLVLRVEQVAGKAPSATLDSPDQGALGMKVTSVEIKDGTLTAELKPLAASFAGKLDEAGTTATGEWSQGGGKLPLTLKKVDKATEVIQRRPQMPKPPFPYNAEDVAFENKPGKARLAGTLTVPEGAGPFPAALLITGSGPQDRDETLMGHKPFLVLADDLTRRGIAVLRVDDRGVGKSTGDLANATSKDFAGDVKAGVAYLKTRKEVDPRKIGLIGHSEGGLIAPMVAAESGDVAFVVLLAGTGLDGSKIIAMQARLISAAAGASAAVLDKQAALQARMIAAIKANPDAKLAATRLKALAKEILDALTPEERAAMALTEAGAEAGLGRMNKPWFRYFLTYDPVPTLSKVKCPVLAINGEKDLQVPPRENLKAIADALKAGGNARATIVEIPGVNHLFQTCKTGSPGEYAQIEETFAPAALKVVGEWVVSQTR